MKRMLIMALVAGLVAGPALADRIEQACLKSERGRAQPQLCRCIQDAADLTLNAADQKLAATFFADPHRAQEIRQSDRRRHEVFWKRYENFGQMAQAFCE